MSIFSKRPYSQPFSFIPQLFGIFLVVGFVAPAYSQIGSDPIHQTHAAASSPSSIQTHPEAEGALTEDISVSQENESLTFPAPHLPNHIYQAKGWSHSFFTYEAAFQNHEPIFGQSDQSPFLHRTGFKLEGDVGGQLRSLFRPDWQPTVSTAFSRYGEISLILNPSVERNLRYFHEGIPDRFQGYLNRFEQYKELVQQIFLEFGLPKELGYLSLVESGFNPRAYSRARASGPWQFMKSTGKSYGLKVNWYIDQRRDPVKSTVAAAHHLRDLYDTFGSWPLALAAYNAGAGKIKRAIRKTGSRDFWKIRRTWYIRRETKEYVPRFIAATIIATNPSDYGFTVHPVEPKRWDEVRIEKPVHLRTVANTTGISLEDLRTLNPELRRNIIPTSNAAYHLKVPVGMHALVTAQRDQFQEWKAPPPAPTQWYRVRWGDSLSVVAKRYGMSVRSLKRMNNLSRNLIHVGDRLRVRQDYSPVGLNTTWYTVRHGDSLSVIAQRFGMTIYKLKRLNNLRGNLIHVGQKLRVKEAPSSRGETKWYKVRRGDSLWSIAKRFSVSVSDLKILNNLTSSIIRAGRKLMVYQ